MNNKAKVVKNMSGAIQKIKVKKKIDIKGTIDLLKIKGDVSFKITEELTANQVRACVSRLNKGVYNYSTCENGLEITVTRNK